MRQIRRRRLLLAAGILLGSQRYAWSRTSVTRPRIGVLASESALKSDCTISPASPTWTAFLDGLKAYGYVHGQGVTLLCRSAEGNNQRLDALAAELIALEPAVIVAAAAPASLALKRATSTMPIVSVYTADPVRLGLVRSLARPGGNITGLSALASDYVAKSLQLLKEIAPKTTRVGVIGQRSNATFGIYRAELEAAARTLDLALEFANSEVVPDIGPAFARLRAQGANAFLVMHQPFTFDRRKDFVAAIAEHRLPAMFGSKEAVELGGLASYAVSVPAVFRRAGFFVDRILKGARPADLPVEQPIDFEMAINLKTANDLAIKVPPSILTRADRVIE